jgi:hypothetical protein
MCLWERTFAGMSGHSPETLRRCVSGTPAPVYEQKDPTHGALHGAQRRPHHLRPRGATRIMGRTAADFDATAAIGDFLGLTAAHPTVD